PGRLAVGRVRGVLRPLVHAAHPQGQREVLQAFETLATRNPLAPQRRTADWDRMACRTAELPGLYPDDLSQGCLGVQDVPKSSNNLRSLERDFLHRTVQGFLCLVCWHPG